MLQGRQREIRTHAVSQAALVWGLSEMSASDVEVFLHYGELGNVSEPMPHMPEVDRKVAEIVANGGRLIV